MQADVEVPEKAGDGVGKDSAKDGEGKERADASQKDAAKAPKKKSSIFSRKSKASASKLSDADKEVKESAPFVRAPGQDPEAKTTTGPEKEAAQKAGEELPKKDSVSIMDEQKH